MAKAGRKPTGQQRPNIVQVTFSDEEFEFIGRHSIDIGMSTAAFGRQSMLPPDWRQRLPKLRMMQGKPLHSMDGRRKSV